MLRAGLIAALGAWMVHQLIAAVRTGIANAAGTRHGRATRPVRYWLTIGVQAAFVVACAFALYRTTFER